jgi:hypothetical protein
MRRWMSMNYEQAKYAKGSGDLQFMLNPCTYIREIHITTVVANRRDFHPA